MIHCDNEKTVIEGSGAELLMEFGKIAADMHKALACKAPPDHVKKILHTCIEAGVATWGEDDGEKKKCRRSDKSINPN